MEPALQPLFSPKPQTPSVPATTDVSFTPRLPGMEAYKMDDAASGNQPPPNFLLLDSPNDGETGTYACPFDGCDGVVCGSAHECHLHLKEWHAPPYAQLSRHVRATGHQNWICAKESCDMKGVEFESHLEYRNHVIASDSHRSLGLRDAAPVTADKTVDPDETLSEASAADYYMCLEPCCCRYLQRWTERMYEVHVKSHCHLAATEEGKGLLNNQLSTVQLEEKQHALRTFLCDAPGCPQYGKCLSTSQSYYYHLQTWNHMFPAEAAALKNEDEDSFWLQPEVRRCTVHGCLQLGRRFATEANYQRHVKSVHHLRAVRRQATPTSPPNKRVNRRLFAAVQPVEEHGIGEDADDEMGGVHDTMGGVHDTMEGVHDTMKGVHATRQGHTGGASPAVPDFPLDPSPLSDTPSWGPPSSHDSGLGSPTPSRPRRELFLERRNRQLEMKVQRLQLQMNWLCRQN